MPGRDRSGPRGMGPMTGRTMGYCGGFGAPGYSNIGSVYVMGSGQERGVHCHFGRGGGHGFRHCFYATGIPGWMRFGTQTSQYQNVNPEIEKHVLKNQAENMQSELDRIKKRLDEIEGGSRGE